MSAQRIQLSRKKGWRKPANTVVVSRPGYFGNPYRLGGQHDWFSENEFGPVFNSQVITPALAVELYRRDILDEVVGAPALEAIRRELRGKDLACWCALDQPCHADVLLKLANLVPEQSRCDPRDAGDPDA